MELPLKILTSLARGITASGNELLRCDLISLIATLRASPILHLRVGTFLWIRESLNRTWKLDCEWFPDIDNTVRNRKNEKLSSRGWGTWQVCGWQLIRHTRQCALNALGYSYQWLHLSTSTPRRMPSGPETAAPASRLATSHCSSQIIFTSDQVPAPPQIQSHPGWTRLH